jgi:hypothetical protein
MISFIKVVDIKNDPYEQFKKVIEEWEEWRYSVDTDNELPELVDLINALSNLARNKFGNKAFKEEQNNNTKDVLQRYEHMLK